MHVGIKPSGQGNFRIEGLPAVARVSWPPELETGVYKLDVGSFPQSVVDDGFVLVYGDGTGGVDEVSAGLGVGCDAVDGAEDELLLEVRQKGEVTIGL